MTRILVVEDHAFFSQALELLLGRRLLESGAEPAEFRHAATVAEGLGLVAEAGPFALAIVDLMLPDGDGREVVRAVKGRWPETPVCVLSSLWDLSGALAAGADEAIGKGLPLTGIVTVLERLMRREARTGT